MTGNANPEAPLPRDEISLGDVGRLLWRKLKDMKTVFHLLLVLAAASLLATLIPQGQTAEYYVGRYGAIVGHLLRLTGLDHVSSASWFLVLMAVLMLSLLACSGHLYSLGATRWRLPPADLAQRLASGPGQQRGELAQAPAAAVPTVLAAARRAGFQGWDRGALAGQRCLYLVRHRWTAWGAALAHYAVFLIGVGALLGALPGLAVDEYVEVREQQVFKGAEQRLPFDVRLNSFEIRQLADSQGIENYYSDVSLLTEGQEVRRQTISVNKPLRHRGYFLSQASWGLGAAQLVVKGKGGARQLDFPLTRGACPEPHDGGEGCWGVPPEEAVTLLPEQRAALVVAGFYLDARRQGKQVLERPSEVPGTPALHLILASRLPEGRPRREASRRGEEMPHAMQDLGWVLVGETRPTAVGDITFKGVTKSTGLGIRKDPGMPLVWVGFVACLAGLVLVFYFPLQQGYVTLTPASGDAAGCELQLRLRGGPLSETEADTRRLLAKLAPDADQPQDRKGVIS